MLLVAHHAVLTECKRRTKTNLRYGLIEAILITICWHNFVLVHYLNVYFCFSSTPVCRSIRFSIPFFARSSVWIRYLLKFSRFCRCSFVIVFDSHNVPSLIQCVCVRNTACRCLFINQRNDALSTHRARSLSRFSYTGTPM